MIRRPPRSPLFPYTPLSRSKATRRQRADMPTPPLNKEDLAYENQADQRTQQLQRDASKRLERLLEALKESLEMAKNERSEEHTSELQSQSNLVCRLLLEKKN